jgi:hypothetical protein
MAGIVKQQQQQQQQTLSIYYLPLNLIPTEYMFLQGIQKIMF